MKPFHWIYALLFGYFWTKCARCHRGFGGHQWGGDDAMTVNYFGGGTCTYCPSCAKTRDRWDAGWKERRDALYRQWIVPPSYTVTEI